MSKICCPVCWRGADITRDTIKPHRDYLGQRCPMSAQPVPGRSLREVQLEHTATSILCMAAELRDDVDTVWRELATADAHQLREWLMIALAAIDIERPVRDLLAWVEQLPTADAA